MTTEECDNASTYLILRQAKFGDFYEGVLSALVDFVERLEIRPAHDVLNHAYEFLPLIDAALSVLEVQSDDDRIWLIERLGYFIGEYFVQRHGGSWYVEDRASSRFYSRYVVGRFSALQGSNRVVDPFFVATTYADTPRPRSLRSLVDEVESEIVRLD